MTGDRLVVAFGCLVLGANCAADDANFDKVQSSDLAVVGATAAHSSKPKPKRDAIEWAICPEDFLDECAWVPLPLDHAEPDGPALPIFVSRRLASSGHGDTQLWLLQGGPGGSANAFKDLVEQQLAPLLPDVDFYLLEQRGVGESAALGCTLQEDARSEAGGAISEAEWPACIDALKAQWGDRLSHFTTTDDSEDLASLIRRTREPNKQVIVYGHSYGTLRAMRLLQTHPHAADGVVLDAIVAPGVQYLSDYDLQWDPVARELAALCDADPLCGAKLGPASWDALSAVMAQLNDPAFCAAFSGRFQLRQLTTLLLGHPVFRAHLFALAYRLERCTPQDVAVVQHYIDALPGVLPPPPLPLRVSPVLSNHVSLSELWADPPPSAQELEARCASQVFCPRISVSIGPLYDQWPRYAHDEYAGKWPTSRTPILAMNGSLDSATPLAKAELASVELDAPHQTFVAVPWSSHGVVFFSPVKTPGAPTCGIQMLVSFVGDPKATPDTTCLDDLAPVDFSGGDSALVQQLFGTNDPWEN
ncbi:MAG TPA: alpha/beta fold hydrolase [Polyangiales bacterium]|nr:alpha/beta fold hydrolase [Polyangiales bacterium]